MKFPTIPYERFMAWAAGPISIVAGFLSTKLIGWHFLGSLGFNLHKASTAAAIVKGLAFLVGAAVTYLGHAKWFQNLPAWWSTNVAASTPDGATATYEQGPSDVEAQGFKVGEDQGTPADSLTHAGCPTPEANVGRSEYSEAAKRIRESERPKAAPRRSRAKPKLVEAEGDVGPTDKGPAA